MNYVAAGVQRKADFENTLLELMQEMPYDRITVKDLTKRIHFVRKTFYHYFRNKQSCKVLPPSTPAASRCPPDIYIYMGSSPVHTK